MVNNIEREQKGCEIFVFNVARHNLNNKISIDMKIFVECSLMTLKLESDYDFADA